MSLLFKQYCEAFFWTVEVEVVRPGQSIIATTAKGKAKKIPKNFYDKHKI